jgi:hypothetical protein
MVLFFEPMVVLGLMCQNQQSNSELALSAVAHAALMIQDYIAFD